MNIVMIGTGNVATVLGKKIRQAGHTILQVVGRNSAAASQLAYELNTVSTNYRSAIAANADIYLIAVADTAITELIKDLKLPGGVVAHTAASVPMEILQNVSAHYGVFYPLQTLRKEMQQLPETPVFYDGNDSKSKSVLENLAQSIAPGKTMVAGNDERIRLHVAAVVVSNFTNYLYILAEEFCVREGIGFHLLQPLIEQTASRLRENSPKAVQTGPAMRQDLETINHHLDILKPYPEMKKVYEFLSQRIQNRF